MELCTARAISNLPRHRLFTSNHTHLCWKPSLSLKQTSISRPTSGWLYYTKSSLRSTTSEETSSGASQYHGNESDGVLTVEDVRSVDNKVNDEIVEPEEDVPSAEKNANDDGVEKVTEEDSLADIQKQFFDFLEKLDIKLDFEDSYSVLLFGGGTLVSLWLITAIVGAIDSIPVLPKLMEVVGLGYTLWFSTRYLIFKKNREELASKIEDIKQQVLGSNNE